MKKFILRNKKKTSTPKRSSNDIEDELSGSCNKKEQPCNVEKDSYRSKFSKKDRNKYKKEKDGMNDQEEGEEEEDYRRNSYLSQLRSAKEEHDKDTHDHRVQELQDQNQYLMEKVQFLKMQKNRNEKEIDRMDAKQLELKKVHEMYSTQLRDIENMIVEWQQFHTSLVSASEVWFEYAAKLEETESKWEEEESKNDILLPSTGPNLN